MVSSLFGFRIHVAAQQIFFNQMVSITPVKAASFVFKEIVIFLLNT